MGYSPSMWGKQAWHFIHLVALQYPEIPTQEDRDNYLAFFKSLQNTLPCPACSKHFQENMERMPINLDSREGLFKWTVDMHNEVNKKTNKRVLSYDEAKNHLRKNSFVKEDKDFKIPYEIIIGGILFITLIYFFNKNKPIHQNS